MKKLLLTYSLLFIVCSLFAQGYIVNTISGNGLSGYAGDGGLATDAELSVMSDAITDNLGNVYIADSRNQRIRKVNTNAVITTIAGNGVRGYMGDNALATAAELHFPCGLAADNTGDLFVVDDSNNCVRKINSAGIITTIAGSGIAGFSGDSGLATLAELHSPTGIAVDGSGNIYIADYFNQRVRKIDTNGIITTIAGNGSSGFSGDGGLATLAEISDPNAVAINTAGVMYFVDEDNDRVRKVNSQGIITTIAGNGKFGFSGDSGAATSAELFYPYGVAVDTVGNIYIADAGNDRIRVVNSGGVIFTIAGNGHYAFAGDNGLATAAEFAAPSSVAISNTGNIYVTDTYNYRVRELTLPAPTGLSGIDVNNETVKIHPVPGNGNFTVALKGSGYQLLTVYDETGKQMLSKVLNKKNVNSTIELDMSMYANGIYFAKIIADKGIVNKKIVIQK